MLLQEIFRGYPVAKLSALLGSNNIEVVESGIWVLAELGAAAVSLLREVEPHLRSRSRKVRYWSIGVVHSSAGSEDGKIVAEAFGLLEDDDVVIRRAALFFLYRSSEVQLTAAIDYCGGGRFGSLLAWLRDVSSSRDAFSTIVKKLQSSDRLARLVAAAAAARIYGREKSALEWAAAEGDEEISVFAARELQG
ncbi:hypothetical protein J2S43_000449 [Catenuloplanes nepalensis]|uniref:HEAT repeat domain-containing protein n=1 Tax=Catenuloplanes nepalensis TaxID=587533 RepID=A0ABT9MKI5_9ACTN|nr:hypothetical protein [Catenuloplanes nepalensis]